MGPVKPAEVVTRFVVKRKLKNYIRRNDNSVKHNIFLPHGEKNDTSVFRISDITSNEIWRIGNKHIAEPQDTTLSGRVDLKALHVYEQKLNFDPDNTPPRHANIIGWPETKDAAKLKALKLAAKCEGFSSCE